MLVKVILIFVLQLIYVPVLSLRTVLVVKGETKKAPLAGFVEGIIYIASLGIVFSDLTNIYNMIAYVVGYSVGIYLGGRLENKLAIGYRVVQINLTKYNENLVETLRENKFGVTTFKGRGRDDERRYRLEVMTHRVREKEVIKMVEDYETNAFIISFDLTQFKGGYLNKNTLERKLDTNK